MLTSAGVRPHTDVPDPRLLRRRARTIPLILVALACGCGPTKANVWGAVLFYAPLVYVLGLGLMYLLYDAWKRREPALQFGSRSHLLTLAAMVPLAWWGAQTADFNLLGLVVWLFGSTFLSLWLLIWRIGHRWRGSQAFRWSGAVTAAVALSPGIAGLADPRFREFGELGIAAWLWGGLMGGTPLVLLIWFALEVGRIQPRDPPPGA